MKKCTVCQGTGVILMGDGNAYPCTSCTKFNL
jgi:hypothetical protein